MSDELRWFHVKGTAHGYAINQFVYVTDRESALCRLEVFGCPSVESVEATPEDVPSKQRYLTEASTEDLVTYLRRRGWKVSLQ